MAYPQVQEAVKDVALSFQDALDGHLNAVYLFGSLAEGLYEPFHSDINLLVIIDSNPTIEIFEEKIRPIWQSYSKTLRTCPIVTSPASLNRHLIFFPLFASHLRMVGQLILGNDYRWPNPDVVILEHIGRLASTAAENSVLLGSALLTEQAQLSARQKLRKKYKQIFGLDRIKSQSDEDLIEEILVYANERISDFPELLQKDLYTESAPPLINRLIAIYESENCIYLVFPDLATSEYKEILESVVWEAVADRVSGSYIELRVTTAAQLRLILRSEFPADYRLKSFSHIWGFDVLEGLDVDERSVFQNQGRLASEMLLLDLPTSYLNTTRGDLAMLVHDLQNKLLNIQLRHELLCRLMDVELEFPVQKLPSREAPAQIRLQGIIDHLEWWAGYYFRKMILARTGA